MKIFKKRKKIKIIVIGDIHGSDKWEDIVKKHINADKIIFLGDYLDPYLSNYFLYRKLKSNFLKIIKFKQKHLDKVELLIGNHDLHYLYDDVSHCTRYNVKRAKQIREMFDTYRDLFKVAYKYENHLFTHAGVSEKWILKFDTLLNDIKSDYSNIDIVLNDMVKNPFGRLILNKIGDYRKTGGYLIGDNVGGPLWLDKNESYNTYLEGLHQYVGHSKVKEIKRVGDENSSITFCDCLFRDIPKNYLILEL